MMNIFHFVTFADQIQYNCYYYHLHHQRRFDLVDLLLVRS